MELSCSPIQGAPLRHASSTSTRGRANEFTSVDASCCSEIGDSRWDGFKNQGADGVQCGGFLAEAASAWSSFGLGRLAFHANLNGRKLMSAKLSLEYSCLFNSKREGEDALGWRLSGVMGRFGSWAGDARR